jgi:uncharacterized protein (TIGR03083 family)
VSTISADRWYDEITGSTAMLAQLTDGTDLTRPVPTCPEWTLRQLITHVGRAHRWATAIVTTRSPVPIPFREVPDGKLPENPREHAGWLRTGAAGVVDAVRTAGDEQVWTHPGPGPARYWARRMAHETAVHRADGQIALGQRPQIDPVTAADGIDEWLGFLAEPDQGEGRPALAGLHGKVLHMHVTDEEVAAGEWMIRPAANGLTVEPGHGKGDVALRGPASDLLLLLLRRIPPGDPAVEVLGDAAVLDELLAVTPF